jgi:hypothetical protein
VAEEDVGATLTVDHHRPRIRGGTHRDENLVYCCHKCNEYKGDYWHETDPPHVALLHPLLANLRSHVGEREDGRLDGLTPEGEFFIGRLRLNRPQLVAHRLRQRAETALRAEADALRQEKPDRSASPLRSNCSSHPLKQRARQPVCAGIPGEMRIFTETRNPR